MGKPGRLTTPRRAPTHWLQHAAFVAAGGPRRGGAAGVEHWPDTRCSAVPSACSPSPPGWPWPRSTSAAASTGPRGGTPGGWPGPACWPAGSSRLRCPDSPCGSSPTWLPFAIVAVGWGALRWLSGPQRRRLQIAIITLGVTEAVLAAVFSVPRWRPAELRAVRATWKAATAGSAPSATRPTWRSSSLLPCLLATARALGAERPAATLGGSGGDHGRGHRRHPHHHGCSPHWPWGSGSCSGRCCPAAPRLPGLAAAAARGARRACSSARCTRASPRS